MYETITTRNERATRYIRHVARERYRRRILALQWIAAASLVAWAVVVGALVWVF